MAFTYGTQGQALTITLASLTNGSARQSTVVDNTSTKYDDVLVFLQVKTGASGVGANGTVLIYGLGTVDGTSVYTDNAGASDAAITLVNAPIVGSGAATANATSYYLGPFSVAKAFGGILPQKWAIAVSNSTGGTFDTTGGNFLAEYQGVNF